jgi:NADH:ubiquinone oxidoreductase subunit H
VGPSDFFKQLYASSVVIESPSVSFDSSTFFYICVFAAKVQVVCLLLVFIRAAQPRYRFDQLIQLCWKYLFPLTLALAIFTIGIQYSFVL